MLYSGACSPPPQHPPEPAGLSWGGCHCRIWWWRKFDHRRQPVITSTRNSTSKFDFADLTFSGRIARLSGTIVFRTCLWYHRKSILETEAMWQRLESAEHATPSDLSFGGKPNVTNHDLRNSSRLLRADCNFKLRRHGDLRKQKFESFFISISGLVYFFLNAWQIAAVQQ